MLTSLFSLFYVTGEFHRFLHRGRAILSFPSCLDLTRSFNISFFILQLFSNPVTNLCVPVYIRIFSLNVVHFAAQQFLVLAPKKAFWFVYFMTAISRSKMQISNYCFAVKCQKICPNCNERVNTQSAHALGNYVTLTTFYE